MSGWHPKRMKMYADLIGNYKKQRIKSLCGNTVSWANQIRMLGQNFQRLGAVIGGGLIAWLRPAVVAINNAMDGIIAAVQRVVNALGKIFGWEMIVDTTGQSLIEDTEEVADAWDDATGAAKKYAKQLLGIDEINNLTTNDGGRGSGDDGGFGGLSGGNIIKPGGIEFKKFESEIDDLFKLGTHFSDGLKKMLDGINWNDIYRKASNFGTGLADFLNGLIKPDTFYSIGRTIANALNASIQAAFSFSNRANWDQWGEAIGQGINGFFGNFNFSKFAKTIKTFVHGIWTMLAKAVKTIKWGDVFKGVFDFVKNLDFTTVFSAFLLLPSKMKAKVGTALKAIYTYFDNYFKLLKDGNGIIGSFVLTSPKMTGAVNAIQSAMDQYNLGIKDGFSRTQSFNGAIKSLNSSMSPLAKGVTTAVAGFAEFALVSNGVKNLTSETGNLAAGIAELALGVAGAGAAFTLVFGFPAGLIATGIVGIVGAVKGLYDSFKEAENLRFAESVRNALTGNGGVPLDEYLQSVSDKIASFGNGFERVAEKSQALQSADKNVSDIVFDIERLKLELKNCEEGTEEYAEKVEQLKNKFNDLSDAIQTKFSSALDVVLAGLSPDSPFAKYLDSIGVSVDEHKEAVVSSFTDIEKKIQEYNATLNDPDATPEQIEKARQALIELNGVMDETSVAAENLRTQVAVHGLDWKSYFNDGELDTQGVTDNLNKLGDTARSVGDTFESGMNDMINAAKKLGDEDTAQFIIDYMSGALEDMNTQSAAEIKKATDALQYDLIDNMNTIIENAQTDWTKLDWFEKRMYDGDVGQFVYARLNEYKNNVVAPISEEINTSFKDLGLEGAGWASSASEEIFGNMFEYVDEKDWFGQVVDVETKLKTDYKGIIDGVLKDVDGADITKGVLKSASDVPESEYKTATDKVESNTEDAMRKSFDSHSPAKTMFPVGKDIVLGVFKGFEEVDFQGKMSEWWTANVSPWFTVDLWHTIGDGMVVGLTDKWNEFTKWFNDTGFADFWTDINNKFSAASWTFTGITDGLKASFNTAIESVKLIWNDFAKWFNTQLNFKWDSVSANGKEVVKAGSVNLGSLPTFATGGYPTQGSLFVAGETYGQSEWVGNINGKTGVTSGYEITGIANAIYDTSAREMELLRQQNEYLMGILNKEFGISRDAVGEASRSYARDYYKRTGNQAYSF